MKPTCKILIVSGALLLVFVADRVAVAGNVDLSTVPKRNTLQLTIYNSEDLTLVRETRAVTFKKGVNPLEFSWANTLIDPSSVELKFLTHADKLMLGVYVSLLVNMATTWAFLLVEEEQLDGLFRFFRAWVPPLTFLIMILSVVL